MASNSEYEQQRMWSEQNIKPIGFIPGDSSQMWLDCQVYLSEQERKYWFQTVTGISGVDVNLFKDKELNQKQ